MRREEYIRLVEELSEHEYRYYVLEDPSISDRDYDRLYEQVEAIEEEHPDWTLEHSPTNRVAGGVLDSFERVLHPVKLLSLDNSYDEEDLRRFSKQVDKEGDASYVVEWKIDGLSVSIEYREGIFYQAATRGDGSMGELITQNMRTISALPMRLKEPVNMILRAEVYMPKKSFQELNSRHEKEGTKIFANARNAASGSLRQQDPAITRSRQLSFFVFEVLQSDREFETHVEKLEYLRDMGFRVAPFKIFSSVDEILNELDTYNAERAELVYDVDGLVVKVNESSIRKKMGYRAKSPKYSIAYKFAAERVETILKGIRWTVGRTGVLTPTALLEPVWISGSKVSKASLHNVDYIKEKDLHPKDRVIIEKAGEIIPQVVSVVLEHRRTDEEFEIPTHCPSCHEGLHREDAFLKCLNLSCPARLLQSLKHFVSRQAMDIDGLGEKNLNRLIRDGFISSLKDLYLLKERREELVQLEGFGEKSIDHLLDQLEASKKRPLSRFLYGLGIANIGTVAARDLAVHFRSLASIMKASVEDINAMEGFGTIMSQSVKDFFDLKSNQELLGDLVDLGLPTEEEVHSPASSLDKTFVVTGSFEGYSRDEIHSIIEREGGSFTSSVSKKTDYLVVGEKAGSKKDKAESLGIKTLTLDELWELLGVDDESR